VVAKSVQNVEVPKIRIIIIVLNVGLVKEKLLNAKPM